jgi:hypothetical protein
MSSEKKTFHEKFVTAFAAAAMVAIFIKILFF